MDKQGTNWTMDGLPIEGGFDVAANDDDEVTNNCDYCGKELDGPWDDFCEEHQDRADEDEDSGKEGSVRRASKVAGGEEDYDEGWDQAWADAQHGNLPDPEDFTGTHSIDWEAGYQDYLLFGDRDESLPWDPDEDDPNWMSGFDGGTIGKTADGYGGDRVVSMHKQAGEPHNDAVTAGYWGSDDHLWGDGPADVVDEVISRKFGEADWDAPLGQMAYPGDFEDYWNDSEVQGALEKAALEFSDDIGRPPSEQELRDGLAFSLGLGDGAPRMGSHKTEDPRSRMSSDDLREAMVEVYDR